MALGKKSSPLGGSFKVAGGTVILLGLGMAPAQVGLRLELN